MSADPIAAGQLSELAQRHDLVLATNGLDDRVVPDREYRTELRPVGWWKLLDRDQVLGWMQTLIDEGVEKATTEQLADRINAWYGLPASDAAYAAELARTGDASEPFEDRKPGPHETNVRMVGSDRPRHPLVPGEWAGTCIHCYWVSANSYRGPLTAAVAGDQHLMRQGLTPPDRKEVPCSSSSA